MRNRDFALGVIGMLGILCAGAAPVRADDGWTLVTSDFKRQSVNLKGIDDSGIRVVKFGEEQPAVIPMSRFLQIDRGQAVQQVRGNWTLYLASGDRIGGDPVGMANDNLIWNSPAVGKLEIPLKEIRGIARGQEPVQFDAARTEDAVFLANGDSAKGILSGIDNGKILMKQASGDVVPVDLSAAKSIHLAAAGKPDTSGKRAFRVQLSDGSAITAPKIEMTEQQVALIVPGPDGKPSRRAVDLSQVMLIEQQNGPVSWLSSRYPDQVEHKPMFEISFPPQMDRNYRGDRIKFGGREYARGIGVHAYTRLTWNLDGGYKALRTQYALNEDAFKGMVTVRILLDDKVVHEAKDFGPGKLSPVVLIDLGKVRTLTLEAHPGGDTSSPDPTKWNIDTQARLNWIEPALLREKPSEK